VDIELHGQQIRAGDKVVMWFASGNRDEEVFTRPSEVDVTRHPNPHLVFGRGPHYCLGAALARMELRVMVETLLPRLPNLTLAGPPRFWRSNWVRGIHRLPVRVRARGAL
jgi:cytochrome P450